MQLRYGQTATDVGNGLTTVTGPCYVTKNLHSVTVPTIGLRDWAERRALIQDALPDISREDREFLISGTSPEGWAQTFSGDDEDDDDMAAALEEDAAKITAMGGDPGPTFDTGLHTDPPPADHEMCPACDKSHAPSVDCDGNPLDASARKHYVIRLAAIQGDAPLQTRTLSTRYYLYDTFPMPDGRWDISYNGPADGARRFLSVNEARALWRESPELQRYTIDIEPVDAADLCPECNQHALGSGSYVAQRDPTRCFGCNFWLEKLPIRDQPNVARIGASHYIINPEDAGPHMRGCGGSEHFIVFTDGRRVRSTNVWVQGEIPPLFRDRLPDNAEFSRPVFTEDMSMQDRRTILETFRASFTVMNVRDIPPSDG